MIEVFPINQKVDFLFQNSIFEKNWVMFVIEHK